MSGILSVLPSLPKQPKTLSNCNVFPIFKVFWNICVRFINFKFELFYSVLEWKIFIFQQISIAIKTQCVAYLHKYNTIWRIKLRVILGNWKFNVYKKITFNSFLMRFYILYLYVKNFSFWIYLPGYNYI